MEHRGTWRSSAWRPAITVGLALMGLGIGLAIATVDSSPGWDDTGITAGALVIVAAALAALDGHRPWLWAVVVGGPTAALEIVASGNGGALLAVALAAVGALAGWAIGTAVRRAAPPAG